MRYTTTKNIKFTIIDDVLLKQSLDVDVVTGSTVSSKTVLKAIETALNE